MLAGDTGCPPGSGLVHMKYLAVVTGACCDFIGHVLSLPRLNIQIVICHPDSRWDCFYTLSLSSQTRVLEARDVFILTSYHTRVVWFYLPHYCPLSMECKPIIIRHVARAPGDANNTKTRVSWRIFQTKRILWQRYQISPLSLKLLCHFGSVMTVEAAEISDQFSLSLSPSQSEELISFLWTVL